MTFRLIKKIIFSLLIIFLLILTLGFIYFLAQKPKVKEKEVLPKEKTEKEILQELTAPQEIRPPPEFIKNLTVPQEKVSPTQKEIEEILKNLNAPQ